MTNEFESHRAHLHAVAYRMLGSVAAADDAVQDAWLRYQGADTRAVTNLRGWLTTVVSRLCLDALRVRATGREASVAQVPEPAGPPPPGTAEEMELARSVGLALLVVLDTLAPAERVAFVLHDLFDMAFEDIAPIVDRELAATRQLASRARRRVRGDVAERTLDVRQQRALVDAFLIASRSGDLTALLTLLAPDVVLRSGGVELRGPTPIVEAALKARARAAETAWLSPTEIGAVIAPAGRLYMVLRFTVDGDRITALESVDSPAALAGFTIAPL